MISSVLSLLIAFTLPDDTALSRFCTPLAGSTQTIVVEKTSYGHEVRSRRASIFIVSEARSDGDALVLDNTAFPPIRLNRWGYPDEVVFGRYGSRLLGLKIHESVQSVSQVLDEFDGWVGGMKSELVHQQTGSLPARTGTLPVPESAALSALDPAPLSLSGLDRASITSDSRWAFLFSLRTVESLFRLVPSLDHVSLAIAPARDGLIIRGAGTVTAPDTGIAQLLIQIDPRPSTRADFFSNDAIGPNARSFTYTTADYLVHVEVTPLNAVIEDITEWISTAFASRYTQRGHNLNF